MGAISSRRRLFEPPQGRVPVFERRARRAITSHPKLYFADTGLFTTLRPRGPLDRPEEMLGPALEGLVAQHLRAWIDSSRNGARLHFWRTPSGSEVDFVLYGPDLFVAIEVKNTGTLRPEDFRSLRAFGEDYPEASRLLLYRGDVRRLRDGVLALPVEEFLPALVPGRALPGLDAVA